MYTSLLLTVLCAGSGVLSSSIVSPCEVGDGSCLDLLGNTLKPIIFSAMPEYGVESSDPLFVEEIEGELSTFKYKFFNITFVGYSNCVISNLIINEDVTKFYYDMNCPKISLSGKYDISGQLIGLPVEGNGDFEVTTGKYFLHFDGDLEKTKNSDGKTHAAITSFKLKLVPQTAMHFDLKNLYNGQKDLSDAFHKLIHKNWREIAEIIQDPIWDICMQKVTNNINKYLQHVALDNFLKN